MLEEDYCSYEVAKLLKEKGFDEPCECAYSEGGQYLLSCYKGIADRRIKNDEALDFSYSSTAPTHQMAMKWLRKKGIYIYIQPTKYVGGALYGFQAIVEDGRNSTWKKSIHHEDNYEESVEAALKYSLENLI